MDNRRVLLISPTRPQFTMLGFPHLGLALLARKLTDHGFEVQILDYVIDRGIPAVEDVIESWRPGAVGVTVNSAYWSSVDDLLTRLQKYPEIKKLIGGPHATLYAEDLSRDPRVHYVFRGESEESIVAVCENPALPDQAVVIEPARPPMDQVPVPAFHLAFNSEKITDYPLQTSRGCPFACIFCEVSNISSKKWRPIPIAHCLDELRLAREQYPNIRVIGITDDNPAGDQEHFKEFLREYIKIKGAWELRVDNLRADGIDRELVELLETANCKSVCFGVEHGHPEMFQSVHKGETLDQIREACRLVLESDLQLRLCFVIGLPGDNFEKTKESVRFALENKAEFCYWNIIVPHKGTKVRAWYESHGRILQELNVSSNVEDPIQCDPPAVDSDSFPRDEIEKAHFYAVLCTNTYRLTKRNRSFVYRKAWEYGFYGPLLKSIGVQFLRRKVGGPADFKRKRRHKR